MRAVSLTFLLLALLPAALACKTESSPAPQAQTSPEPAANPHAGLDPATAARAEAARAASGAAGAAPQATASGLQPRLVVPSTLPELPGGRVALGPFSMQLPSDWKSKPTVAGMRAAELQLPETGGKAEVIVYYFGESGAGSVQANIDRWVGQFTQPDGKPSKDVAKVETAKYAGQEASVLSVSGRYASRAMPGAEAVDKENQSMLAAIVPSPKGPYYFRLIGDRAAVEAQSGKFRELLTSLKLQ
jgi:hypothetical protein